MAEYGCGADVIERQVERDLHRISDTASSDSDWWTVWEAIRPLVPERISLAFLHGMTGGAVRGFAAPLTYGDLEGWLPAGLRGIGVRVELARLPADGRDWLRLLRERTRRGLGVPLFAFGIDEMPAPQDPEAEIEEEESSAEQISAGSLLMAQGLVMEVGPGFTETVTMRDPSGKSEPMRVDALRQTFTHGLLVRRGGAKGRRGMNVLSALGRWISWTAAFPERCVGGRPEDAPIRALASAFLREVAGSRHDRIANRLWRAGYLFATCRSDEDIDAALYQLRTAVCLASRLPAVTTEALLAPIERPLSDIERRELIYLARAGTRDLKAFAAWRLRSERHHSDVLRTLEQLCYDPDAWVRAAVSR